MRVVIVMGSSSDLPTLQPAVDILKQFGVDHEIRVISAHRTPFDAIEFGRTAREAGIDIIIAAAGGAAHLPGVLAATTTLPVIGVPVQYGPLEGMDALLSIVQMPKGIPVATVSIGGAQNAALLAMRILGVSNPDIAVKLEEYRLGLEAVARKMDADLQDS